MKHSLCVSYLQPVALPVRMEEHAVVFLSLIVTVPVGMKEPIVTSEVLLHACIVHTTELFM